MNVSKRLDLIAAILAVIAGVVGFFLGVSITDNRFTIISNEYIEWANNQKNKQENFNNDPLSILEPKDVLEELDIIPGEIPEKYIHPSKVKLLLGGMVGSISFYIIVFIGISVYLKMYILRKSGLSKRYHT